MSLLFNEFIYRPIYNLLVFIYNVIPFGDFGVAIIILTLIIRFLIIPLSRKQIESQKKIQELQPKIKEIQEKYKNDKEKQSRALMEFYKKNKANPLSGCLPMIFQLIFFIAIYRVLLNISNAGLLVSDQELYPFISNPGQINQSFLGIINLSGVLNFNQLTLKEFPQIILVLATAVIQFIQTKMLMPTMAKNASSKPDISQTISKQMLFLGPLLTLFIGLKFQAGLVLYWFTSTVFSVLQQYFLKKKEEKKTIKANL